MAVKRLIRSVASDPSPARETKFTSDSLGAIGVGDETEATEATDIKVGVKAEVEIGVVMVNP
ncbi:protein of unknown function [Pararobbsia alpina]|uniref:hypothetical protein n=1 Tax=Pararobbsia alpina TaxID=621374 RepID=UPI0039A5DE94